MSESIPNAVCVYCGSSLGNSPEFKEAADALGRAIGKQGRTLVYGGGSLGLMGAVSAACRDAGGKTLGIIPRAIAEGGGEGVRKDTEIEVNPDESIIVESMHERKTLMAAKAASGFVGLPGGFGTFEEVLEAVTWVQLGIQEKPIVLLNVNGFYSPLRELVKVALESGFIRPGYDGILKYVEKPEGDENFDWGVAALEALSTWTPPKSGPYYTKWNAGLSQT